VTNDAASQDRRECQQAFGRVEFAESQSEARVLASEPGVIAIVRRGADRAVLFLCPCGCGEMTVINLDPAIRPVWHHYFSASGLTLMPSVWRTTGCCSHYIVWRNCVYWCDDSEEVGGGDKGWPLELNRELIRAWRTLRLWQLHDRED
jgi:hypothetical protein